MDPSDSPRKTRATPSPVTRLAGVFRLVHPFPSALDAAAAGAIALIAGGGVATAARLAIGMLGLQFSIGVVNDLVDVSADRLKPHKPLATGALRPRDAAVVLIVVLTVGLVAAASVGPGAFSIGLVGLGVGLLYDVRLKGTTLAWLAFAVGVGLLPVYAWWGATGRLPATFLAVFAVSVAAGASLAVANALADLERDRAAGTSTVATVLGRGRALAANAFLLLTFQAVAVGTSLALGPEAAEPAAAQLVGVALGWGGLRLAAARGLRARQLGWEIQAIGVAAIGAGWIATLAGAGLL